MAMQLLLRPHRVVLPVLMSEGILLTRLIMGRGVNLMELVTSTERLTIHVDVYSDTLFVDTTVYPKYLKFLGLELKMSTRMKMRKKQNQGKRE